MWLLLACTPDLAPVDPGAGRGVERIPATTPSGPSTLLEVVVRDDRTEAWLGEGAAKLRLAMPDDLAARGGPWAVGVTTSERGERIVRFGGQFLAWSGGRRLRWLHGEANLATLQSRVWAADWEPPGDAVERCLYAEAPQLGAVNEQEGELRLTARLEQRGPCVPPAPPVDCSRPPPSLASGLVQLPSGDGLVDPVLNGETSDQERGWIQAVIADALRGAAHDTACIAAARGWPGTGGPLVVGDRSMADGSIPPLGEVPAHPYGSHVDGWDVDVAYYQASFAPDNHMRPVCVHIDEGGDRQRCLGDPILLDARRTALLVGRLAESPRVRCVGVDGQVALALLEVEAELVRDGLIAGFGEKLCFETEDHGRGWFYHHHDHLHVSGRR